MVANIQQQFEQHRLFRRLLLTFLMIMYAYVTVQSFSLAYYCVDKSISASDIAIIIGCLQVLMTTMLGYAFKVYSNSRDTCK